MGDLATLPTFQAAPTGYSHSDFNAVFAALTIANGAVSTNKLADQAVTFQKMQNIATQTLLGRSTAGTGLVEALTLGAGLALAAAVLTVGWLDSDSSHRMRVACGSNITADRTVTLTPGDSDRTITLTGNATLNQDVSTTGSPSFQAISGTTGTFTGAVGTSYSEGSELAAYSVTNTLAGGYGAALRYYGKQNFGANAIVEAGRLQFLGTAAWTSAGTTQTDLAIQLAVAGTLTQVGRFTSTGLNNTVIGGTTPAAGSFTTLTASGVIKSTVSNAALQLIPTTTTDGCYGLYQNTGGIGYVGLDNSTGGNFGFGNYSFNIYAPTDVVISRAGVERARATATGLVVTGDIVAKTAAFTDTAGTISITSTTGTNRVAQIFVNTGGTYYAGVDNSVGSSFGGTAYALLRYAPSGRVIQDIINSVVITTVSSTGVAVVTSTASTSTTTGALVVTGGAGIGGAVWIGGVCNALSFNTTSSRRFKTNIMPLAGDAPHLLRRLRPVSYGEARLAGRTGLPGLIAEEVEPILPSLVSYDAAGRVEGLNYAQFVSPLIAGWQHHDERLNDHDRRLGALEKTLHGKN